MALINNLYVQVVTEDWNESVNSTSHPVEKGIELNDMVRKQPKTVSLSGNIVAVGNTNAEAIIAKLQEMKDKGSLISYIGRRIASNMQIQSFNHSYSKELWGGCSFSMELKEVRIAKVEYIAPTKPANTASTGKIKVGDIVVFKGGNVYVSSDAPKAATTKGRQTCRVERINERSWSKHDYHLISTEKQYPYNVYGWVDIEDIEGGTSGGTTSEDTAEKPNTNAAKTSPTTQSGTQQVNKYMATKVEAKNKYTLNDPMLKTVYTNKVYYKTKAGDTIAKILSAYKDLRKSTLESAGYITQDWILTHAENKNSVSVYTTTVQGKTYTTRQIKIGVELFVGYEAPRKVDTSKLYKGSLYVESGYITNAPK